MTNREKVIAALDAPGDLNPFRTYLAEQRLEQSSTGRVASRVLRMGFGAKPSRAGIKELIRLQLDWMCEPWCRMYEEVTGEAVVLADLIPVPEPEQPKRASAKPLGFTYRAESEPYCGVIEVRQARCSRFAALPKCVPFQVLRKPSRAEGAVMCESLEAACSAHDSMVRQRGHGHLNHRTEIDSRSASTFVLQEAA